MTNLAPHKVQGEENLDAEALIEEARRRQRRRRRYLGGTLVAILILRAEGLLEFRRGRGVTVAGTPAHSDVLAQVHTLVKSARRSGFG